MIKKIFKTLIILSISLSSINFANAAEKENTVDGISSNIVSPECSIALNKMVSKANDLKNTKDSADSEQSESYYELSKECFGDVIVDNLTNKIMYLFYGDVIVKAVNFTASIFDIDEEIINNFEIKLKNIPKTYDLSIIIQPINVILNIFISFFLIMLFGKLILTGMQGGFKKEHLKIFFKITLGFSIIIPLPMFNGYSLIQAAFIFCLIFFFSIANLLAIFTMFIFQILSIFDNTDNFVSKKADHKEIINFYNQKITDLSKMYICDIRSREKALDISLTENKTKQEFMSSELYNCLNSSETIEGVGKPKELLKSEKCLKSLNLIPQDENYCGSYKLNDSSSNSIKKSFYDTDTMNFAKNAAIKSIEISCKMNNLQNTEKTSNKKVYCAKIGSDFKYSFDEEDNLITIAGEKQESGFIGKEMDSFYNEKSDFYNVKNSISEKMAAILLLKLNKENSNIDYFSDMLASSLKNGWLGTYVIYYTNPELEIDTYNIYMSIAESLSINKQESSFFYDKRDPVLNTTPIKLDDLGKQEDYKTMMNILDSIIRYNDSSIISKDDSLKKIENENYSFSLKSILNVASITNTDNQNCYSQLKYSSNEDKDILYTLCSTNSINPLKKISNEGKEIINYVTAPLIISIIAEYTYNLYYETEQNIFSISRMLFSIIFGIGVFFGYMLPLIPTMVFISICVSMFLSIFYNILTVNLIAMEYFAPKSKFTDIDDGSETRIYSNIINIIMLPILITASVVFTFVIIHFSISLVNIVYSFFIDIFFYEKNSANIIINIQKNLFFNIIYLVITTLLVIFSSMTLKKIPELVLKRLGYQMPLNSEGMFAIVKRFAERVVYVGNSFI